MTVTRTESAAATGAAVLDNPVWHALAEAHASFAEVRGLARRYHPDVSVFWALSRPGDDAWADLAALAGPGAELLLTGELAAQAPPGWEVVRQGSGHQLVLDGDLPDLPEPAGLRPLGAADVPAMQALIDLAQPGPFRPRTVDLGGYVGVFRAGALVAMAGHRLRPPGYTEVSAVATHPDHRNQGLGAAVTVAVARTILARGETPFLHVAESNVGAKRVYERLGFTERRRSTFAVLRSPLQGAGGEKVD